MIAVDTNLLVFAHREDSPFHEAALHSLVLLAEGRAPWAIPWPCIHEFFSIATHPRIYNPPTPIPEALDQIEAWMEVSRRGCPQRISSAVGNVHGPGYEKVMG